MSSVIIGLLCVALVDFITNIAFFIIEVCLAVQCYMPTDVLRGLLDVSKEPFLQYMPYVNYFVPLDYAVLLFGAFIDTYAFYICFKYFKKILSSILGNGKSPLGVLTSLLS